MLNQQHTNTLEKKIIIDLVLKKRKLMARLGTRKLHYLLQPEFEKLGIRCGRDKLFEILRDERMLVKKKKNFTKTTNSMHRFRKHPNLIENLEIKRPEQVWVSDITYIRTKIGFLYLSLITDVYSKQIMGFELADNLRAESSIKALKMAIKKRRYPKRKLIHHSDRGLQYCTPAYTNMLLDNKIRISMTSKYDPYENAVAERVNGILKTEFDAGGEFINQKNAQRVIKESIKTYNKKRPHLSIHYRTPKEAHKKPNFELKKWKNRFSSPDMSGDEKNLLSLRSN
jgi:transposase InsO family protein